jgi:hypothetical protein
MHVTIYNFVHSAPNQWSVVEFKDDFESTKENAIVAVKRAKKDYKLAGKSFSINIKGDVYRVEKPSKTWIVIKIEDKYVAESDGQRSSSS